MVIEKTSKLYPKRRAIAEHFCCGNSLPLLLKLEQPELVFLVL